MDILNAIFKFFAFIFEKIGNFASLQICFGYLDESEIPKELLEENK